MVTLKDLRAIIRNVRPDLDKGVGTKVFDGLLLYSNQDDAESECGMFPVFRSFVAFGGQAADRIANIMTVGDLADIIQQKLNKL